MMSSISQKSDQFGLGQEPLLQWVPPCLFDAKLSGKALGLRLKFEKWRPQCKTQTLFGFCACAVASTLFLSGNYSKTTYILY